MSVKEAYTYNMDTNIASDTCWKNARENNNNEIYDYSIYNEYSVYSSKDTICSLPEISLEHANLRGRCGFGLSDNKLIDNYSSLRNDPNSLTHDKCSVQLYERVFQAPPLLKGAEGDLEKELDLLSGNDTNLNKCKKNIMENEQRIGYPLIECLKDIQHPDNIVPNWTNGGDDTRSHKNRAEFNKIFNNDCNN
jgi:hypothetical protein|tara:strand:+ start:2836 stop:3414 length:579 start_codon:yes stop_codon:yes gene_type:complete